MKNLSEILVLVLGIGESGLAMARWCARQGARVRVADTRTVPPCRIELDTHVPDADVVLGPFTVDLLDGVALVALSPGIDLRDDLLVAARGRGIDIVGEMTLFAHALRETGIRERTRIVAITGTNGKTTTTALAAELFRAAGLDAVAAGNISPSVLTVLTERLDQARPLPEVWVLELSSFQIESMSGLDPDAATVLNVSDDHLDRHVDMQRYAEIKARIFDGHGLQVLNRDDTRVVTMGRSGRTVVTFGSDRPARPDDFGLVDAEGHTWLMLGDHRLLPLDQLPIAGVHNALNALAALALGLAIGCALDPMLAALTRFRGLPHRMEIVARRDDGVTFYNDSKGTNVGATIAALEGIGRPTVLIAGGDGKGQDFSVLREPVASHARAVVLIGRDAERIGAALAGLNLPVVLAKDMDEAVAKATELASGEDAVLLSPACASLDMFRNYSHRGEVFKNAVLRQTEVSTG